MITWCEQQKDRQLALLKELAAIPAPSHQEDKRVAFIKAWLEERGAKNLLIDEAKNVILPFGEGPYSVFMAHTDVVFPDLTPLPVREEEGRLYAPGVGDDTANVVALMLCAQYLLEHPEAVKGPLLLVFNSCEEGLGNLKGSRALAKAYGDRITAWISFDGMSLDRIVHRAVGSHRYQVTVRTEGGHSFGAFGNRNAIAVLSSMISTFYTVKVPQEDGSRTTYNVGQISGGTSVNTIAQEARMLFEYRSDNRNCLEKMRDMFEKVIDAYRATGVEIEVELVGDRPCAGKVDPQAQQALEAMAQRSILIAANCDAIYSSGSTDCNIPLSLGIPSVCLGVVTGKGAHTREEILYLQSLVPGCKLCLDFLSNYFA